MKKRTYRFERHLTGDDTRVIAALLALLDDVDAIADERNRAMRGDFDYEEDLLDALQYPRERLLELQRAAGDPPRRV